MGSLMTKEEKIISGFLLGSSVDDLMELCKLSRSSIYYYLRKNKINKRVAISKEQVRLIYEDSKRYAVRNIALKYKINKNRVCRIINSYKSISQRKLKAITMMRDKGFSAYEIGNAFTMETERVREIVRENNIKKRLTQ